MTAARAGAVLLLTSMTVMAGYSIARGADASTATCQPVVTNPDGSSHQACTYPTPGDTNCTTQPHTGQNPTTGDLHVSITVCDTAATALRRQILRERAIHTGELRALRIQLRNARRTWRPTVDHAIALAAATYQVDRDYLRRVATCESTLTPTAVNGRYVGLYQFGLPLWNGTRYRAFERTDPYAAALAAAWAFSRGMKSHWPECGLR